MINRQPLFQTFYTAAPVLWTGDSPLLRHHEDSLNHEPLEDLWSNALEQAQGTLVFDDKLHHLNEAFEGFALPDRRGLGLQPDLGHDKGLCDNGSQSFRHGAKHLKA